MKLSAAVSMGLFLLPEMATAAGGFYNSCKSTHSTSMQSCSSSLSLSADNRITVAH
jgi:hypothetical protein